MGKNNEKMKPWYLRTYRWGQTNLTEIDPIRYDNEWWRKYWRKTNVQGIIVNASGIVTYYPTKFSELHKALYLEGRDLFGDIVDEAQKEDLVVLARIDSNRVHNKFYMEHPNWTAVDKNGEPYKAGDLYIQCINSPYYYEYLPEVLKEIIETYDCDGITDNSWSGLDRNHICYCQYCREKFKKETGLDLPAGKNWQDKTYKKWIEWSYSKRIQIWEYNNKVTRKSGGEDCVWAGMLGGNVSSESRRFRDLKELGEKSEIVMLDMQARREKSTIQQNGEAGKLIHQLVGWEKLVPESTPMYQAGNPTFRKTSNPKAEALMWAYDGAAGGIQPWWHHIGAYHEDRRQYETSKPLFEWHKKNEKYLIEREPVANIGILWSQRNIDFYGQDNANNLVMDPWEGFARVLIRGRTPYLPVHIDNLDQKRENFSVLILPHLGVMTDEQCESIRDFVYEGGSIIASGETSLYNKWGEMRKDFALADLFKASSLKTSHGSVSGEKESWDDWSLHSYLRLFPELRAEIDGPYTGEEPEISDKRHQILEGFGKTDILPFGGNLHAVEVNEGKVLFNFIPPFPIYPPETSWMREYQTNLPGLVLNETECGGRIAYLAADIDRCYGRDNLPDHYHLLNNIVRWAARDNIPLEVKGEGFIDCHLYQQEEKLILHIINLTNSETWKPALHELVTIGPFNIKIQCPENINIEQIKSKVNNENINFKVDKNNWIEFEVESIKGHELIIIE